MLTDVVDNAVIAVDARVGLAARHESRVAILVLPGRRCQHHALEVNLALIPAILAGVEPCHGRIVACGVVVLRLLRGFLLLEVAHGCRSGLYDDEIFALSVFSLFTCDSSSSLSLLSPSKPIKPDFSIISL